MFSSDAARRWRPWNGGLPCCGIRPEEAIRPTRRVGLLVGHSDRLAENTPFNEPAGELTERLFTSTLQLLSRLDALRADGAQVVVATHSPLLTALPGATILELGEQGIRKTTWDELEIVAHWRRFLDRPDAYLRALL